MLSVIICSKNPRLSALLKENIDSTVGIPYEYIVIDNSTRKYSIFTAYNKGIEISSQPYLCFVHEDVAFNTQDWGKKLCTHLSRPNVGILGICGSAYQSNIPAPWSLYEYTAYIVQSDKKRKLNIFEPSNGYDEHHEKQVVGLDGVFLAARRDLFNEIAFDEKTFEGFHAYDMDICLQAHTRGFQNKAINDLLLTHYSRGNHNSQWVRNILLFADKWQAHLPILLADFSAERIKEKEIKYMKQTLLGYMVHHGYTNDECKKRLTMYLPHYESFITWVQSSDFDRYLFWLRFKKKPLSLVKRQSSTLV